MKWIHVLIVVFWFIKSLQHAEACTYGRAADCVFPCNCEEPSERCDEDSGLCAESGCKDGPPTGFTWSGPGCRVGNIAYNKTATSLTVYKQYFPSLAVDGNTNPDVTLGGSCFHSGRTNNTAYWMVDLGAPHVIYNVTLFNRASGYKITRLQDFTVYVSDSSNITEHMQVCKYHPGWIASGGSLSLECEAVLVARYVSVINGRKTQYYYFALCEFVVIGAVAADCSLCGPGGCDPLNGCDTCPRGKRKPNCVKVADCVAGTYGNGCSQKCHCRSGSCDVVTGECEPAGCMDWWMPPTCTKYIAKPIMADKLLIVISVTSSSVQLQYEQLVLNESMSDSYYYALEHHDTTDNVIKSKQVSHNDQSSWVLVTIDELEPEREYVVQLVPYRVDISNNITEAGVPTKKLLFATGESGDEGVPIGLIIGPVVAVLLVIGAVICIVLLIRRRKSGTTVERKEASETQQTSVTRNQLAETGLGNRPVEGSSTHGAHSEDEQVVRDVYEKIDDREVMPQHMGASGEASCYENVAAAPEYEQCRIADKVGPKQAPVYEKLDTRQMK